MRTKNAKRLWPVPATLAVMAVAALLAFGLMATNGAQPAAAQSDDPDCEITVIEESGATTVTLPTGDACDAVGDTASVEFMGSAEAENDVTVSVLIEDKSGPIKTYPNNTTWDSAPDNRLGLSGVAATSMRYRYQLITIPAAEANPTTGDVEGQKVTITVQGDIYVWPGTTSVTTLITGIPPGNTASGAREISDNAQSLDITFLGMPALGKDGADHNTKVDDVQMEQCHLTTDMTRKRLVGEAETCVNVDPPGDLETGAWTAIAPNPDLVLGETRSKLVIRTGTGDAGMGDATVIFDGKKATHTLTDIQEEVTIFALVQDATGNNLLETAVDFNTTTVPDDIIAARDLSDDPETARVVLSATDNDEEIHVQNLQEVKPAAGSMVSAEAVITANDAVAAFTLSDLPTDTSYLVTVEVTVGSLKLGTVEIARTGSPEKVVAGVFNIDCFDDPDDDDDYLNATFDAEAEGCDDSGMADMFGRGQMFVVKAHHEDALDLVVGDGADLSSAFANDDDDLLGDEDVLEIDDPVDPTNGDPAQAWLYTIDDEATLGDHMITVSTDVQNADKEDIASVTLTVTVAGPPTQYMFVDPVDNIELGSSAMFTVQAYDAVRGLPHFGDTPATDYMVEVFIQGLPNGNTRNLDATGMLTLNKDTGMGTFTIYAPNTAEDGDTIRIFVASGDMEQQIEVTFGEPGVTPGPDPTDEFTADYTVTVTSTAGSGMVDVSWTRSEELNLSLVSLIQGDKVVDFNITPGISTPFSGVDPGEYDVSVFSFRITEDGEKDGEIAFGTVTVE